MGEKQSRVQKNQVREIHILKGGPYWVVLASPLRGGPTVPGELAKETYGVEKETSAKDSVTLQSLYFVRGEDRGASKSPLSRAEKSQISTPH